MNFRSIGRFWQSTRPSFLRVGGILLRVIVAGLSVAAGLSIPTGSGCSRTEPTDFDVEATAIDYALIRKTRFDPDIEEVPPEYPPEVARLDGQWVKIAGYMSPFDSLDDMRRFMLRPTPVGCFFCAVPSPVEVVLVRHKELASGEEYPFIFSALEVVGKLRLWREDKRDSAHQEFPLIIENATLRKLSRENVPEELREKHEKAGNQRPSFSVGEDGEEEDF